MNQIAPEKGFFASRGASLFDKRALGLSRNVGEGRIPPNWKLFMTLLFQTEKNFFFSKRTLSNDASDPRTHHLSKTSPALY